MFGAFTQCEHVNGKEDRAECKVNTGEGTGAGGAPGSRQGGLTEAITIFH